jgi:hypothetical protein
MVDFASFGCGEFGPLDGVATDFISGLLASTAEPDASVLPFGIGANIATLG